MKKSILILFSLLFVTNIYAGPRKVLLEFCTGTWCPWCPCGDNAAEQILIAHPNTIILAYHGASSDPWQNFNGNSIRSLLGFSAYPTGVIDRGNHPGNNGNPYPYVDYSQFAPKVDARYSASANSDVDVVVMNKSYNSATRQLTATVNTTALQNLTGQYKISLILTEDNLVYTQSNNNACITGGAGYVHKWTVRSMINNPAGDNLNTGSWNQNQMISTPVSISLDPSWIESNCNLVVLVFKDNPTGLFMSTVEQASQEPVTGLTGINPVSLETPDSYTLSQNFPNPFNPTTNIKFTIPKDGNVTFKVYDMVGNVVASYLDGFTKAGSYNVQVDGSSLSSGVYFYTLTTKDFKETKKMILTK